MIKWVTPVMNGLVFVAIFGLTGIAIAAVILYYKSTKSFTHDLGIAMNRCSY
mgnify:CR=1 FL=1|jgi:hypothetical protein